MPKSQLSHPYLLTTDDLTVEDIYTIFTQAQFFLDNSQVSGLRPETKKYDYLKGKTVALAFFEPSTRTRLSFELAAKRLSADTINFSSSSSSLTKGESLIDTLKTIEAMGVQIFVVRHGSSGVPIFLQQNTNGIVINAGDGKHEHPTQALLDSFTLYRHFGKLEGLKLCLVGDILHSRVARSNITLLRTLGVEIGICSPGTLIPSRQFLPNIKMFDNVDDVVEWSDVLMVLRLQKERMEAGLLPSIREFSKYFGISLENFKKKPEIIILHPGPVNYGIELDYQLAYLPNVLIQTQVTHGVFIRTALLYLLAGNN